MESASDSEELQAESKRSAMDWLSYNHRAFVDCDLTDRCSSYVEMTCQRPYCSRGMLRARADMASNCSGRTATSTDVSASTEFAGRGRIMTMEARRCERRPATVDSGLLVSLWTCHPRSRASQTQIDGRLDRVCGAEVLRRLRGACFLPSKKQPGTPRLASSECCSDPSAPQTFRATTLVR